MNGTLALDTEPGRGTRFVIELPLTLSITDAMIATVGDRTFAVPQIVGPRGDRSRAVGAAGDREPRDRAVPRRRRCPIVRLSRLFGIAERPRRALHAFVVGTGLDAVGIAVDRINGQREVVVRTMADAMIKVEGIAGATDLGDGRVVLILNMGVLARIARPALAAAGARRTGSA